MLIDRVLDIWRVTSEATRQRGDRILRSIKKGAVFIKQFLQTVGAESENGGRRLVLVVCCRQLNRSAFYM